ncbi:hypothetical protein [Streptomyces sp. NPDC051561]|uniref:hypothetical protein n=1 Tax=Streptomyces sp. NPDC051561 TaxID=3365658 RepID=UPI0037B9EDB0
MDTTVQSDRLPARVAWDETGTVLIPGALDTDRFGALVAEAQSHLDLAEPHVHEHTAGHRDGSFATPVHCAFVPPGPVLGALAFDKGLLAAVREATGIPRLIPRGGAVVLYERGDFQGLHTDSVKSTVTVALALSEGLPPMGWAPHLRNQHPDELSKVVAEHGIFPEGGNFTVLEHPFGDGSVRAFAGYAVPHWRPRLSVERELLVTMSFFDL